MVAAYDRRWSLPLGGPPLAAGSLNVIAPAPTFPQTPDMPLLRHYDRLGTARFITFTCYHRRQLLTDTETIQLYLQCLGDVSRRHAVRILGWVVMPEHVHLVLHPPDGTLMGAFVGELKSRSARAILQRWRERRDHRLRLVTLPGVEPPRYRFWQGRCYDHNCRTPQTAVEKINYCHNNPVARKLVAEPGQWRWSSHDWYAGVVPSELVIDGTGS